MRRFSKVVALVLACMVCVSLCSGAMAYSGQNIEAVKVSAPITVDGDLGEWDLSSGVVMDSMDLVVRDPGQWSNAEDCTVNVYVMWDEENMYIAARILDDTPFMYREGFPPDMADSLVLFFSTDANADPERTAYTANDFRFTQIIDDYDFCNGINRDMIDDDAGFESMGEDGDEQILEGFECAVQEIDGGYTFEAIIPWSNFSNENLAQLVPVAGMTIGFDVGMFDLDFPCPGVATVRMQASGTEDADTNPSVWGTLTFVEK